MKIILHSNLKIDLLCKTKDKTKKFKLNNNYTLNIPKNWEEVSFTQQYQNEKPNIFGFIILTLIISFFETQKTFEKRDFISYYDFAKENLVSNFSFFENDKEVVNIYSGEQEFKKFRYSYWTSNDVDIVNTPPKKALKRCLTELIGFWFIVLFIPIAIFTIITIVAYIKSGDVFDVGIALIAFLLMVFICNTIVFVIQYFNILKNIKSTYDAEIK